MLDPWGYPLTEDEVSTVHYLTGLTGRTAAEVVERVTRSREDFQMFRLAVSLNSEFWDYLDGQTGQWFVDMDKQERQVRSYASRLFDDDMTAQPSPWFA